MPTIAAFKEKCMLDVQIILNREIFPELNFDRHALFHEVNLIVSSVSRKAFCLDNSFPML